LKIACGLDVSQIANMHIGVVDFAGSIVHPLLPVVPGCPPGLWTPPGASAPGQPGKGCFPIPSLAGHHNVGWLPVPAIGKLPAMSVYMFTNQPN